MPSKFGVSMNYDIPRSNIFEHARRYHAAGYSFSD